MGSRSFKDDVQPETGSSDFLSSQPTLENRKTEGDAHPDFDHRNHWQIYLTLTNEPPTKGCRECQNSRTRRVPSGLAASRPLPLQCPAICYQTRIGVRALQLWPKPWKY